MTVNECLTLTDSICPNGVGADIKCRWLSELEGRIQVELLGTAGPARLLDAKTDGNTTLSAKHPYDQLYWMYLTALIELLMGDGVRYENRAALFNTAYQNYTKHLIRQRGAVD
jgi:hypothetical protein